MTKKLNYIPEEILDELKKRFFVVTNDLYKGSDKNSKVVSVKYTSNRIENDVIDIINPKTFKMTKYCGSTAMTYMVRGNATPIPDGIAFSIRDVMEVGRKAVK